MPEIRSQTSSPAPSDELVYKVTERPAPIAEEKQMDLLDVARSEAQQFVEFLADEVGSEIGKLAQRNSELERRVRELEVQLAFEKRLRELELRMVKLNDDMDADHSQTASPLIPLKGGRGSAA
jgi:hypothetical protein